MIIRTTETRVHDRSTRVTQTGKKWKARKHPPSQVWADPHITYLICLTQKESNTKTQALDYAKLFEIATSLLRLNSLVIKETMTNSMSK